MGCWGMGMAQSDEFCEVYERFMESYDEGDAVREISHRILDAYRKEFADSDGVMHDVYFALAKAEWMCGEQSSDILSRVKEIIDSGANLTFYGELGAYPSDLKIRKRNLDKFWAALQLPRTVPRKRKRKTGNSVAEAEEGLVFWYRRKGLIYGALVLEILSSGRMLVALSDRLISEPKTVDEVLDANVYTAAWFGALLPSNRVHKIGTVEISGSYNGRAGMYANAILLYCENEGTESHWNHEERMLVLEGARMGELLNPENVPAVFRHPQQLDTLLKENRHVVWISCR